MIRFSRIASDETAKNATIMKNVRINEGSKQTIGTHWICMAGNVQTKKSI